MAAQVNNCRCDSFRPIEGFGSIEHFEEFERQLGALVEQSILQIVPVQEPMSIVGFGEKWFLCSCGRTWRLVYPDFPFRGTFREV